MSSSGGTLALPARRIILGVGLLVALTTVAWQVHRRATSGSADDSLTPQSSPPRAALPERRPNDYVGSQACAACHATIAETYAAHPMSHSAGVTPGADDRENFADGCQFELDDGRTYRVVKQTDGVYHHELMRGEDGRIVCDQSAKISFFFGSGARGKSYAVNRGGLLFQSPVSWYTRERKWGASPGYAHRGRSFNRRIERGCVLCHAGRATSDEAHEDRFPDPVLIEAAIGCERCHGPGKGHIEHHRSGGLARSADTIVNPARLSPDRRDAVCYQCHLIGEVRVLRYGRTFGDFRPGDRLEDIWATLVAAGSVRGDGKTRAVSQVEQMHASTCFRRSDGRLGCVSCHDPHATPSDPAVHYRERCLACHAEKGCSLPVGESGVAERSCVDCHMPRLNAHDVAHTSQTDHRILREQDEVGGNVRSPAEAGELLLFDEEQTALPEWEVQRAKALAAVPKLWGSGYASAAVADRLGQTLQRTADIVPDDATTWAALATIAELRHDLRTARQHWQRVLNFKPNDERALQSLAGIGLQTGDDDAGLAWSNRLMEVNPYRPQARLQRSKILAELGRLREAIADAERAAEIDPLDKSAHRWLLDLYRRAGDRGG